MSVLSDTLCLLFSWEFNLFLKDTDVRCLPNAQNIFSLVFSASLQPVPPGLWKSASKIHAPNLMEVKRICICVSKKGAERLHSLKNLHKISLLDFYQIWQSSNSCCMSSTSPRWEEPQQRGDTLHTLYFTLYLFTKSNELVQVFPTGAFWIWMCSLLWGSTEQPAEETCFTRCFPKSLSQLLSSLRFLTCC